MRGVEAHWHALQPGGLPVATAPARRGRPLAVTALTALLVLVAGAVLAMRAAGLQPLTVLTGSMQPTIAPGDLVLSSRTAAGRLRVGQVVTFAPPGGAERTLTHRVTRVRRSADDRVTVTTKGDANPVGETWAMPASGTVGVTRAVVPHAGHVLHPMGAGWTRGVLLGLLTLAGSAVALWVIWRPEAPAS